MITQEPLTNAGRDIVKVLEQHVREKVNERGLYPVPMYMMVDGKLELCEMDMPDQMAINSFANAIKHYSVQAAIIGIDRKVNPEEDYPPLERKQAKHKDVLTCTLYERGSFVHLSVRVRDQLRYGIIEYCYKPRDIQPIRWDSWFWAQEMRHEAYRFIPDIVFAEGSGRPQLGPDMQRRPRRTVN